jgi:hypothetical protein
MGKSRTLKRPGFFLQLSTDTACALSSHSLNPEAYRVTHMAKSYQLRTNGLMAELW